MNLPRVRWFVFSVLIATLGVMMTTPAQATPSGSGAHQCAPSAEAPAGAVIPEPFLKLPFRQQDGRKSLIVSNGWIIPQDEEEFTGPGIHAALDFEFSRQEDSGHGLPVVAAAAGRAYFTYQNLTGEWVDDQGVVHRIGLGAGLVVEVRHANQFVTQYIHLATVAPGIPYLRPEPDPDVPGDWIPTGLFQSNEALWEFGVPVRQGQVLGTQGDTGIGLDWNDQFNPQTGVVAPRDREAQPPWDQVQLHFQVYKGRVDGVKQNIIDPSDRYLQDPQQYTPRPGKFCLGVHHLWQTNHKGQPLYAAR